VVLALAFLFEGTAWWFGGNGGFVISGAVGFWISAALCLPKPH